LRYAGLRDSHSLPTRRSSDLFFSRLVPEGMDWLVHTTEGPDDMPAHIKAALTQTSLSIPVSEGRMVLGTWQGIYLFEHRRARHRDRKSTRLNSSHVKISYAVF